MSLSNGNLHQTIPVSWHCWLDRKFCLSSSRHLVGVDSGFWDTSIFPRYVLRLSVTCHMKKLLRVLVMSTYLAQNIHSVSWIPGFFVVVSQPTIHPSFASTSQSRRLEMICKATFSFSLQAILFIILICSDHRDCHYEIFS